MKFLKWLMPLGMINVAAYFTHVFAGKTLWMEYNPITTDMSFLTAANALNVDFLRIFTTIYGVCFLLFAAGIVIHAFKDYHTITQTGYVIFLLMALASGIGYTLFPLTGDKTEMSFQNIMQVAHIKLSMIKKWFLKKTLV